MKRRSPFSALSFAERAAARRADLGASDTETAPAAPDPTAARHADPSETGEGASAAERVKPGKRNASRAAPRATETRNHTVRAGLHEAAVPYVAASERAHRHRKIPKNTASAITVLSPNPAPGALRLVPLQALAKGGKWRTEAMRSYRMPLLLWFTRGQGRITLAGLTRGYGAHNAIFIPPRVMHGFEVTAQVYGTAVFFAEDVALPLPQAPVHLRVRDAIAQGEITTILEQLAREIDGDRAQRDRAILHHSGLLSVWLDRQAAIAEDSAPDTAALRLVRRFTERVEAQLYTAQGVADYAEALGVTPTHLSRVCRETCGRSASEILADRLTFEARRLLSETTLPVKQVARMLGYGSAAYFTRAFQNRTGQTPTQFRAAA